MSEKNKSEYIVKDFFGSVHLKDWLKTVEGHLVHVLTGKITILKDQEIVGFEVKGTESNWVARVAGPTQVITILGCQIRGITTHPEKAVIGKEIYKVP